MNTYKTRLEEELFSLQDKIQKLIIFMDTPEYNNLGHREEQLLEEQLGLMVNYRDVLENRILFAKDKQ